MLSNRETGKLKIGTGMAILRFSKITKMLKLFFLENFRILFRICGIFLKFRFLDSIARFFCFHRNRIKILPGGIFQRIWLILSQKKLEALYVP